MKGRKQKYLLQQEHLDICYNRSNPLTCYRICFNCSFSDCMSEEECTSLIRQLCYVYNSLRSNTDVKIQIYLTSIDQTNMTSHFWKECVKGGLDRWKIHIENKPFWDIFSSNELVVLSPDAEEEIHDFQPTNVYVIGGLVDRSVAKAETLNQAKSYNLRTYRLPLKKYIQQCTTIALNINTVFDIIREVIKTNNWKYALETHIPQRQQGTSGNKAKRRNKLAIKNCKDLELESHVKQTLQTILKQLSVQDKDTATECVVVLENDFFHTFYHVAKRYNVKEELIKKHNLHEKINGFSKSLSLLPSVTHQMMYSDLKLWYNKLCYEHNQRFIKKEKEKCWTSDIDWDNAFKMETDNEATLFSSLF